MGYSATCGRRSSTGDARRGVVLFVVTALIAVAAGLSIASGSVATAATSTWNPPVQLGGLLGNFQGVSCSSANNCTAVGSDGSSQGMYATETNGVWGPVSASGSIGALNAVSCSAPGDCTAVGSVSTSTTSYLHQPIYVVETNGVWGPLVQIPGQPTTDNLFSGVSCSDTTDCTAVGEDVVSVGGVGSNYATETNGVWSALGTSAGIADLTAVSCASPGDCTAVGFGGAYHTASWMTETNGTWGALTPFPGSSFTVLGIPFYFYAVSCSAAGDCVAVGADNSTRQPIYDIETNGTWGPPADISGSPGGSGSFSGVSCTTTSTCTGVGTDGNSQPMYDTESNGVWAPPTDDLGVTGGSGSFIAVSCSQASACTAVGRDAEGFPIYAASSPTPTTPAPTVVNIAPGSGPTSGGTVVSLTGTNFTGATAVSFGAAGPAESFHSDFAHRDGRHEPPRCQYGSHYGHDRRRRDVCALAWGELHLRHSDPPTHFNTTHVPNTTTCRYISNHDQRSWLLAGRLRWGDFHLRFRAVLRLDRQSESSTSRRRHHAGVRGQGLLARRKRRRDLHLWHLNFYGSIPGLGIAPAGSGLPHSLNAPIVGMVPSADGGGYFMVASDGGVFAFGDAKFEGSCPGIVGGCSGAAVAVMPDASGNGYWLVTATGNVYAFGDAVYHGAPGPQAVPVTAAVRTTDGGGYWLLFSNGVVAPYGDAANLGGPVGSVGGTNPATTIFTTSDGGGYWVASANGSVFTQGDAPFDGSMSGVHLNGSIIAATGWSMLR